MSKQANTNGIPTFIAPGELLDKLTILEIKLQKIKNEDTLKDIQYEFDVLTETKNTYIPSSDEVNELYASLKEVNLELWVIEDDIRDCEREKDFSETFIKLARSVYITNDKRASIKKDINRLLGSKIVEHKSYAAY